MKNFDSDFLKKDKTSMTLLPKDISLLWEKYVDSGDSKTFAILVKTFDEEISFVLFKLRGVAQMTKDYNELYQHILVAFMKVLRKYNSSKDATLKTYVRGMLYNRTIDELRLAKIIPRQNEDKNKQLPITENDREANNDIPHEMSLLSLDDMKNGISALVERIIDQRASLEEHILEQEMEDIIREAIESLSLKQKTAILYYFFQSKTFDRIASIMGISDASASGLVKRGIFSIRAFLKEKGYQVQMDAPTRSRFNNKNID